MGSQNGEHMKVNTTQMVNFQSQRSRIEEQRYWPRWHGMQT